MIANGNSLHESPDLASVLESLAGTISATATGLASELRKQDHTAVQPIPGSLSCVTQISQNASVAKRTLLEATTRLQQLISTPTDLHQQCTVQTQQLASYNWLVHFNIPDHVPREGFVDYQTVARDARVPEGHLIRLARLAMTGGFFHEPSPGHIAHTPISRGYQADSALRDAMLLLTQTNLGTTTKILEMTKEVQKADPPQTPKTAFQLAHDTDLSYFAYLNKHPVLAKRLASGMRSVAASPEASPTHLLESFDWSGLPPNAHVIDLGGSLGFISIYLARNIPSLRFTVQDLAHVVAAAPPAPKEVQNRVYFQAHSFLESQPDETKSDVDVFLIRQCLNNWSDVNAAKILKHLVPCLTKSHSRILINNVVVPAPFSTTASSLAEPGVHQSRQMATQSIREEALARTRDVSMMQFMNGAERDLEQWHQLLADVDERLEIVAVRKPEGSFLSVIEVRFRDELVQLDH